MKIGNLDIDIYSGFITKIPKAPVPFSEEQANILDFKTVTCVNCLGQNNLELPCCEIESLKRIMED